MSKGESAYKEDADYDLEVVTLRTGPPYGSYQLQVDGELLSAFDTSCLDINGRYRTLHVTVHVGEAKRETAGRLSLSPAHPGLGAVLDLPVLVRKAAGRRVVKGAIVTAAGLCIAAPELLPLTLQSGISAFGSIVLGCMVGFGLPKAWSQ